MTTSGGGSVAGGSAPSNEAIEHPATDAFAKIAAMLAPDEEPAADDLGAGKAAGARAGDGAPSQPKKRGRPPKAATAAPEGVSAEARRRPRKRDGVMQIIEPYEFWHGADSEPYVTYPGAERVVHAAVRSVEFKRHVCLQTFKETGEAPGAQATEDALRFAEARAQAGPEHEPMMRVGALRDRLYVDLCNPQGDYVDISAAGWQVRPADADVRLIRTPAMRALPEPTEPGLGRGIDALRPFVNAGDRDFRLITGWLLGALRPIGPYPILVVSGEQGAGKSLISRMLRQLVDPNAAPIRAAPKDCRDLIVGAYNSHAQVFDNLSRIDNEMSDALCRLATGGGFSSRQLHTDRAEVIFYGQRPVMMNGIGSLAERADLAERCISPRLRAIDESMRRTEAELWRDFEKAAPDILGALLDAVVVGVKNLPTTKLERPPRLADFATWITACEPGLGWTPGSFMEAFTENQRDVSASTFEGDAVAIAIRDLIRDDHPNGWEGTPTSLLALLNTRVSEDVRKARSWPFTAQALGNRVDRAAPLLRAQGITVERRHSGHRYINIFPTGA